MNALPLELHVTVSDERIRFRGIVNGRTVAIAAYRIGDFRTRQQLAANWSRNESIRNGSSLKVADIARMLESAEIEALDRIADAWGTDADDRIPDPLPLSELQTESIDLEWVCQGFAAKGFITLFAGLWKTGKTTFLVHLILTMSIGGSLGGQVTPGRALVITEERPLLWARRRDQLGIGDHVEIVAQPFGTRPSLRRWSDFCQRICDLVVERSYSLVVFDTLAGLWGCQDENSASEVSAWMTPLRPIANAGSALVLGHHLRKSDGAEGTASRGSGHLPSTVDIVAEFRRSNPRSHDDRRRVLTTYSRLSEAAENVLELTDEGYVARGSRREAKAAQLSDVLRTILQHEPLGLTLDSVYDKWPDTGSKPRRDDVRKSLKAGISEGTFKQSGSGKKADPKRYLLAEGFRPNP